MSKPTSSSIEWLTSCSSSSAMSEQLTNDARVEKGERIPAGSCCPQLPVLQHPHCSAIASRLTAYSSAASVPYRSESHKRGTHRWSLGISCQHPLDRHMSSGPQRSCHYQNHPPRRTRDCMVLVMEKVAAASELGRSTSWRTEDLDREYNIP